MMLDHPPDFHVAQARPRSAHRSIGSDHGVPEPLDACAARRLSWAGPKDHTHGHHSQDAKGCVKPRRPEVSSMSYMKSEQVRDFETEEC